MLLVKEIITRFVKKEGTKTVWLEQSREEHFITESTYHNCVSDDTIRFFRTLGGSETVTREYTKWRYTVTKIVSTSPDKQNKTVREFEFYLPSGYLDDTQIHLLLNALNSVELGNREKAVIDDLWRVEVKQWDKEYQILTLETSKGDAFDIGRGNSEFRITG